MPIKGGSAYAAIRELFHVYAEKRDRLETLKRVTEDIFWLGTGQGEKAFGKKEFGQLLQREMTLDPTPFLITFQDFQGQSISETAMVGTFGLRAVMQNESKISMDIRGSFSCVDTAEGIKVSSVHTSVPTFLQKEGEFFPVSYGEERLKEALEKATEKLRRSEQRYRMAAENMDDLYILEYDIKTKKCIKQEKIKGTLEVWTNVPESVIEKGVIHPESVAAYRGLHEAVAAGEKEVEAEIVYLNENHRREWYHLKYVTIFDESGNPLRGIGCGRNMTEQKLMEARFNEEMAYREQMDRENLAASLRVNLSRNRIEAFSENYMFQEEDLVFTKALEKLADNVPDAEEKNKFSPKLF